MDSNDLKKYLLHYEQLGSSDIDALNEVLVQYPYFQVAHLLKARCLKNMLDPQLDDKLKITSLYAGNRILLYKLLNDSGIPTSTLTVKKEIEQDKKQPEEKEVLKEASEKTENNKEPELTSEVTSISEQARESVETLTETEKEEQTVKKDSVEKELLDFEYQGYSIESGQGNKGAEDEKNPVSIPLDELHPSETKSSVLIDSFIKSNPKIIPSKEKLKNKDISMGSVQENEDLVTETLAKIYAQQGLFVKAISVYKKLCLKFPEKNDYFASLIKEIEQKSKKQ